MGVFDFIFGAQAPVHTAVQYDFCADGRMHLFEARRGRGKSYGMMYLGYSWLVDVLPGILDGSRPHSRWNRNFDVDLHRVALQLCVDGHLPSFQQALDLMHERCIYATTWDQYLTAFDSLNELDESNRSLDAYKRDKSEYLTLVHDYHQQCRKHFNTSLYGTQYLDWINVQTRKLFDLLWRVKVVRDKNGPRGRDGFKRPLRFNYYGSDPQQNGVDAETVRRADYKMQLPFELPFARMYKTAEPIITLDNSGKPQWASFEEIARWMQENGMKPKPVKKAEDRLELIRAFESGDGWDAYVPERIRAERKRTDEVLDRTSENLVRLFGADGETLARSVRQDSRASVSPPAAV